MSINIDAAARYEAIAVRNGDIGPSELRIGQFAADIAINGQISPMDLRSTVNRLKPRAYGHMGIVVADIVEAVLDDRDNHGQYGLTRIDGAGSRDATAEDVSSIFKLVDTWSDTLFLAAGQVLAEPSDDRRIANIGALEGHWALRRIVEHLGYGLVELMRGGTETAVDQAFTMSYGMYEFWTGRDQNKLNLVPAIRRSNGPIRSAAGLEVAQLDAFNIRYCGKRDDRRYRMHRYYPSKVDPRIYSESGQGTITLREPIEDLPLKRYGSVGRVPLRDTGPRIGCPILLTPKLLQRFWEAYIDSMDEAGLL